MAEVYDYLTTLQGVINGVVGQLDTLIAQGDTAFLKELKKMLERGNLKYPNTGTMWTAADRRWLKELEKEITFLRKAMFDEAKDLVYLKSRDEIIPEVEEVAKQELELLGEEIDDFHKKHPRSVHGLTKQNRKDILDYEPYDGESITNWFKNLVNADVTRIMQDVQRTRTAGGTLDDLMKQLLNYESVLDPKGSLKKSRDSARTIARTVLNGVANNSRMGVYEANSDFIDGVKFLATLDSRTSMICASLDGKIWTMEEVKQGLVKRPPLHPNCRSVLVPYIKLEGEGSEDDLMEGGGRPAERENFEKMAEDRHNARMKENGKLKEWKDLTYNYRKQKIYQEMREYSQKTGKRPYENVSSGTNFKEYFEKQPESFQRSWLGKTRFDSYKTGTLKFEDLVKPDNGYTRTIKELQESGKIVDKSEKSNENENNKIDSEKSENHRYTLREKALGKDPARGGKFVEREMIAALQLEDEIETPLKRLQKDKGGDWIAPSGKIYDLVGPVPEKFVDEQLGRFIEQMGIHDQKDIDVIVLDLSNFKPEQLIKIHKVIKTLKKEIIILNER